jgi:uncharacterized cupin superfamily protein
VQQTSIAGVAMYARWQPDLGVSFNSYFVEGDGENLVVDPLAPEEADYEQMLAAGGVAWVVVSNRDHERAAAAVAQRLGARVATSEADAAEMSLRPDRLLRDGDAIGPARVLALMGCKTPGEFALSLPERQAVLVGDALRGDPAGSLRLMPDERLSDPQQAVLSLCRLRSLRPRHVLVGDGVPVFERGYEALNAYLETREDAWANVVNLDELPFLTSLGPADYTVDDAEIGFRLGAERLGYRATRLEPGAAFCPLHWHTAEEELFVVWEGTPTIETARGSRVLREGDLIAFPTRQSGAHRLVNRSDAPATVILIANTDPRDVCFYPDSKKLLVEATGTLVRAEPILDYYDGEVS